jgi:hypothetical protein
MRMWLWRLRASKTRHLLRIGEVRGKRKTAQESFPRNHLRALPHTRSIRGLVQSALELAEISFGVCLQVIGLALMCCTAGFFFPWAAGKCIPKNPDWGEEYGVRFQ